MSAELNVQVKLNLLEGEVQKIASKLQSSLGGAMNKSASSTTSGGGASARQSESKYGIEKFIQLYANFKLVQVALQSFRTAINGLIQAFDNARKMYGKSLTSGLGIKMTTKMSVLSQVLGVSEQDVLKFGAAIAFVNPKVEEITKMFTDTNAVLAELGMNIAILKLKFEAVSSVIAARMSSTIDSFIAGMSALLDVFKDSEIFQGVVVILTKAIQLIGIVASGIELVFGILTDSLHNLFVLVNNLLSKIPYLAGKLGLVKMDFVGLEKTEKKSGPIMKQWAALFGQDKKSEEKLPGVQSSIKQISASAWEKMGLVIGGKGNTTNELIRQSNKHLSTIAAAVTGTGIARQSFGMNPTVANP